MGKEMKTVHKHSGVCGVSAHSYSSPIEASFIIGDVRYIWWGCSSCMEIFKKEKEKENYKPQRLSIF